MWFKHPGWRPADVAARFPRPAFDIAKAERYDPPMSLAAKAAAAALFAALLGAASVLLWHAHLLTLVEQLAAAAGIVAGPWGVGWISEWAMER